MKKKLNLLWNLKFNFFSVAERPLTFFAYFLNAKKVGRRRLVIGPAKAGAFLFSHTRLPLSPRPLLPFGRISLRETARRSSAPPFGVAAQNRARHFAARPLGGRPLRGHGFAAPHRYFAVPVTAAPRRGPNGKTPALVAVRLHFATRNRSVGRCLRRGGNRKPRVGKEENPRFRGADYGICRWRYFLNVKKVTKEHRGRSVRLKNHDFKFRIKS